MQGASAEEPDDEGQQYLDRQRHAAAVQLHSRHLAIALLRAQTKMPRGCTVHVRIPAKDPSVKAEAGVGSNSSGYRVPSQQQHTSKQAIVLQMTSTAADLKTDGQQPTMQQAAGAGSKHIALKPRPLVHRRPNPAAAQQFLQDVPADDVARSDLALGDLSDGTAATPAPRIVADPAHLHQQLAGWTRVAAPGESAEAEMGEAAGLQVEDLLGTGLEDEGDMMDEEEWV